MTSLILEFGIETNLHSPYRNCLMKSFESQTLRHQDWSAMAKTTLKTTKLFNLKSIMKNERTMDLLGNRECMNLDYISNNLHICLLHLKLACLIKIKQFHLATKHIFRQKALEQFNPQK